MRCSSVAPTAVLGTQRTVISNDITFSANALCSWSQTGLIAYAVVNHGTHVVYVVDAETMQQVQTLSGHTSQVTALLWTPQKPSQFQQNSVQLIVFDEGGVVALWDVSEGCVLRTAFLPKGKTARSATFVGTGDACYIVAVCEDGDSYAIDAMLADGKCQPVQPLTTRGNGFRSLVKSRLCDSCAVVSETRVTVAKAFDNGPSGVVAQQHITASAHTEEEGTSLQPSQLNVDASGFVDACFSVSNSEVLYLATPSTIVTVDWTLGLTLNPQLLWLSSTDVTFLRLFPSFPSSPPPNLRNDSLSASSTDSESDSDGWQCESSGSLSTSSWGSELEDEREAVPIVYTYSSDMRIAAWTIRDLDSIEAHGVDVRGARLASKHVISVVQQESDSTRFVVLFTDGSAVHWRFLACSLRWVMVAYREAPVNRPITFCAISPSTVCLSLDSGAIVVYDIQHSCALRKANIVKAGSTKITHLLPLTSRAGADGGQLGCLILATTRTERNGAVIQVSIVNLDTMSIISTLRRGAPSGRRVAQPNAPQNAQQPTDPSLLRHLSLDGTERYLIMSFANNSFEVWNLETESLIHIHNSGGQAVFWAFPAMDLAKARRCFADNPNLVGNNQQLVGLVTAEGIYYYLPVGDKLLKVQESFNLRLSSIGSSLQHCCVAGDLLVAFDSSPGASISRGVSEGTWGTLVAVPKTLVTNVATCPQHLRFGRTDDAVLIGAVFEDGTFGTWEARSRRRLGISTDPGCSLGAAAVACCWLGDEHLAILLVTGSIAVVLKDCSTANAHVYSRALASPMASPAFLFPTHSSHLKTSFELLPLAAALGTVVQSLGVAPSPMPASPVASLVTRNIAPQIKPPFRNPFGQLITATVPSEMTLREELQSHVRHMLPLWLRVKLIAACDPSTPLELGVAAVAFFVSRYSGYEERQAFWDLVLQCSPNWRDADIESHFRHVDTPTNSPSTATLEPPTAGSASLYASPAEERAALLKASRAIADAVDVLCPAPYASPHKGSEALGSTQAVRRNKASLNIQRMHSLHLMAPRGIDDSIARLHVARSLINMSELDKAGEVLMETSFDAASFAFHAQLAINVAAANQPRPYSTPFVLACKRAGAMLLAMGDVEGAVEKFALIGEHHEACMAMQATGRWMEAAVQARISPRLTLTCKLELLHRWVKHRAQKGHVMPAALLLLRLGAPRTALVLLNECAHFTDTGGLFGLYLVLTSIAGGKQSLERTIASPSRTDDIRRPDTCCGDLTVRDVLKNSLGDYVALLHSTSNAELANAVDTIRGSF